MTNERYIFEQNGNYHTVIDRIENKPLIMLEFKENEFGAYACFHMIVDLLNELTDENDKLKRFNDGQEKEIVRLHKLADAMSGVLRELGIYDVYNEEQIQSIKEKLECENKDLKKEFEDASLSDFHEKEEKIKSLLLQKVKELNDDYEKGAKAGMPTGGIIGELDSFEEICREMGWIE